MADKKFSDMHTGT